MSETRKNIKGKEKERKGEGEREREIYGRQRRYCRRREKRKQIERKMKN